jgi:RimK family alpha-L-glutamate ligase
VVTHVEIRSKIVTSNLLFFMKNKILVLIREKGQSKYEVERIVEEAKKLGFEITVGLYKDLKFELRNGKNLVWIKNTLVSKINFDLIYFRVAGTRDGRYVEARNLLLRLVGNEIRCINKNGYLNWPRMGKIAQYGVFIKYKIPVVESKVFYKKDNIKIDWNFPVIVKHEMGYQGKSVIKLDNEVEFQKFLKKLDDKDLGKMLWQKYLPNRWDLRVIVIKGKVLGAIKRSAVGKEFRSNFSLGGQVESWDLSKNDRKIAQKVAKSCGLDYCGVDIMKDQNGNSFVLEVNRQCQFRGFEKATGINVAKEIIIR